MRNRESKFKACESCVCETAEYSDVMRKNPSLEAKIIKNNKHVKINNRLMNLTLAAGIIINLLIVISSVTLLIIQSSYDDTLITFGFALTIICLIVYFICNEVSRSLFNENSQLHREVVQAFEDSNYDYNKIFKWNSDSRAKEEICECVRCAGIAYASADFLSYYKDGSFSEECYFINNSFTGSPEGFRRYNNLIHDIEEYITNMRNSVVNWYLGKELRAWI